MLKIHGRQKSRLILFVHGFNSDADAFIEPDGKHFAELLNENPLIAEKFDWGYYSYTSNLDPTSSLSAIWNLFRRQKYRTSLPLTEVCDHLKDALVDECGNYDEWYFIAHSMGGLLAKLVITRLSANYRAKVKRVFTLGTPHLGLPSGALKRFSILVNNPQLAELYAHSDELLELNHRWSLIQDEVSHVFYYGLYDNIVSRASAIPVGDEVNCTPVDADHFSIARPKTARDEIIKKISRALVSEVCSIDWSKLSEREFGDIVQEFARKERMPEGTIISVTKDALIDIPASREPLDAPCLIASSKRCNERALESLFAKANKAHIRLVIWDLLDLAALTLKYPEVGIRRGLVDIPPTYRHVHSSQNVIMSVPSGDLINRSKEKEFVDAFLASSNTVLFIVGLSGVGKSVLVSETVREASVLAQGMINIRLTSSAQTTEILFHLNQMFVKAGYLGFRSFYGNSKVSLDQILDAAIEILVNNRFMIVLDNFEDIINQEHSSAFRVFSSLLTKLGRLNGESKVIVTSTKLPSESQIPADSLRPMILEPLSIVQLEEEYIPSLPELSKVAEASENWDTGHIHLITGGIPLALNLLEGYVKSNVISEAYQDSIEMFQQYLTRTILERHSTRVSNILKLIAITDEAFGMVFFEFCNLTKEQVDELTQSTLVQFNSRERCYVMHHSIAENIRSLTPPSESLVLHREAAEFYGAVNGELHREDKNRHYSERRKVVHLIRACEFDQAAILLGRICSRYLSLNSYSELQSLLSKIKPSVSKDRSIAWLLNVEAHMGDFKRAFDETRHIYEQMLHISRATSDVELQVLAQSNYATTIRRKGDFAGALRLYWPSYKTAKRNKLTKLSGSILNNIGQVYLNIYVSEGTHKDIALRVLERAMQIRTVDNDDYRKSATLLHLGTLCIAIGKSESDQEFLDRGHSFLRKSLELQIAQENFWMLDRTYEKLAEHAEIENLPEMVKRYKKLAEDQRVENDIFVSPRIF